MELKFKQGDIVHHSNKRYGVIVDRAPRGQYWDTQVFWKVRWLDLGVIDSLKEEGIRAKYQEIMPERDLRGCDIDQERRVLVGALHALSRKSWLDRTDDPVPGATYFPTAWDSDNRP